MRISRLLLSAIGIELIVIGAVPAIAGGLAMAPGLKLVHAWTLDSLNQVSPIWLCLCLLGALLVAFALEKRRARSVFLTLALAGVLTSGLPVAAEYAARIRQALTLAKPAPSDLKLLQFNVLEINFQPQRAERVILQSGADIVTLQEPHPHVRNSPALAATYPYRTECPAIPGRPCLLMIMSKRPITGVHHEYLFGGDLGPGHGERWARLEAMWLDTTAPDGEPVRVISTHYSWPTAAENQRFQRLALKRAVGTMDKRALILTGDFNSAPWSYAMRRQDEALKPLTRRTRALFTWPAYIPRMWRPTSFTFLAIDHVYAGPDWRMVSIGRTERAASDHYPVLVRLQRKP